MRPLADFEHADRPAGGRDPVNGAQVAFPGSARWAQTRGAVHDDVEACGSLRSGDRCAVETQARGRYSTRRASPSPMRLGRKPSTVVTGSAQRTEPTGKRSTSSRLARSFVGEGRSRRAPAGRPGLCWSLGTCVLLDGVIGGAWVGPGRAESTRTVSCSRLARSPQRARLTGGAEDLRGWRRKQRSNPAGLKITTAWPSPPRRSPRNWCARPRGASRISPPARPRAADRSRLSR